MTKQSRLIMLAVLALLFVGPAFGQPAEYVVFKKNVTQHILQGTKKKEIGVAVEVTQAGVFVNRSKTDSTEIRYPAIQAITYEQRMKGLAYSPKYEHFIIIRHTTPNGPAIMELEMPKDAAPALAEQLELRSGVKADRAPVR